MTNDPNTSLTTRLWQTGGFLLSLIVGLLGGFLLLGTGWLLLRTTPLGDALSAWLGLSAKSAWYLARSSGVVAYLILTASTVWGLLITTKLIKETVPAALALGMHNVLSWLAVALTGVHALSLLFDSYYTYTLIDLTVPFTGPYRPIWVGLGTMGLYLMALTSVSFGWRKRIGQSWWRRLHYLTFLAYGLATVHGLTAGTDSAQWGMKLMFWGSAMVVLFLTNLRIMTTRQRPLPRRERRSRAT